MSGDSERRETNGPEAVADDVVCLCPEDPDEEEDKEDAGDAPAAEGVRGRAVCGTEGRLVRGIGGRDVGRGAYLEWFDRAETSTW